MEELKSTVKFYLSRYGRSLERARFAHHLEGAANTHVLSELRRYQNRDGGFAKGLEPDFYTPESSPIATWSALNIMDKAGIDVNHPMLNAALAYLENTPYFKDGLYQTTIPSMNDHPGAPWWRYKEGEETWGFNPSASLAGFILKYAEKDSPLWLRGKALRERSLKALKDHPSEDMHELRCYAELYEHTRETFPDDEFANLLKTQILKAVEQDPDNYQSDYTAKPTALLVSKHTPGYAELRDLVQEELRRTTLEIQEKGFADITWTWGTHEDAFEKARDFWRGILSVDYFLAMQTFS